MKCVLYTSRNSEKFKALQIYCPGQYMYLTLLQPHSHLTKFLCSFCFYMQMIAAINPPKLYPFFQEEKQKEPIINFSLLPNQYKWYQET